ncbi:MAG: putative hydrolase of the superfamily [Thermoleophilaceae bacterium]|nr:putative hydrolase of the superfamily [Thermoleophilaceae bacterium]MEA2469301.1 putative hydrolase of the superfamily [Thermoleophilaceae bacterium]
MRGLIVDFGGVLTTNVFDSFRAFGEAEGLDPQTVKRAFREDPEALGLLRELERGDIEVEEFEPRFGERIGVADTDGLVGRLFGGVGPDERMLEAVRQAGEAGICTGLISNSWGAGLSYDMSLLDELFEAIVISGDVGMHKPEPAIYMLGAERLGLRPEECVFVDDLRENCQGAEEVGMTAILHRGADSTLPELEKLLGVPLGA